MSCRSVSYRHIHFWWLFSLRLWHLFITHISYYELIYFFNILITPLSAHLWNIASEYTLKSFLFLFCFLLSTDYWVVGLYLTDTFVFSDTFSSVCDSYLLLISYHSPYKNICFSLEVFSLVICFLSRLMFECLVYNYITYPVSIILFHLLRHLF